LVVLSSILAFLILLPSLVAGDNSHKPSLEQINVLTIRVYHSLPI